MTITQAAPTLGAIPASAAWRPGDPVGNRQFVAIGDLPLEGGGILPDAVLAFETWGTLSPARDNAVYVAHALTGDAHAAGDAGPGQPTPGWWNSLIGPGRPLDPARHFIVCANVIGGCQGSTGPASAAPDGKPWGSRFPWVTVRDLVAAEARLTDALGIDRWRLVIGPSLGGMRAVEWAVTHPERVGAIALMGTTAASTAEQIAWGVAADRGDPRRPQLPRRRLLRRPGRRGSARWARDRAGRSRTSRTAPSRSWPGALAGRCRPTGGLRSSRTWSTTATSSPGASTRTRTCGSSTRSTRTTLGETAAGCARRSGGSAGPRWWWRWTRDRLYPVSNARVLDAGLSGQRPREAGALRGWARRVPGGVRPVQRLSRCVRAGAVEAGSIPLHRDPRRGCPTRRPSVAGSRSQLALT